MGILVVSIAALVAAFGAFLPGYGIGSVNGLQNFLGFLEYFHLDPVSDGDNNTVESGNGTCTQTSSLTESDQLVLGVFISITNLGGVLGNLFSGKPSDMFGRKTILLLAGMFVSLGGAVQSTSIPGATWMFTIGRVVAGIGYGMFFMAGPVYIAEIAPKHIRGRLSSLIGPFVALGILTGYAANIGLAQVESGWRLSRLFVCFLGCAYIFLVAFLPHSPRWLMLQGRETEARSVLGKFAQKNSPDKVDTQIEDMKKSLSSHTKSSLLQDLKVLLVWKNLKRVLLGLPLQFFVIATGNPIYFYSESLFCSLGIAPFVTTIVVGVLSLCGAIFTTTFIDKLGRKLLLFGGGLVMTVLMAVSAILIQAFDLESGGNDVVGYVVAILVSLFMLIYTATWFVVPWVITGEMFPLEGRGVAVAICTAFNWLTAYALTQLFPVILAAIGSHGSLYMLGLIDFVSVLFVLLLLPETKGTSLEDVELLFDQPWMERVGLAYYTRCAWRHRGKGQMDVSNPISDAEKQEKVTDSPQLDKHGDAPQNSSRKNSGWTNYFNEYEEELRNMNRQRRESTV